MQWGCEAKLPHFVSEIDLMKIEYVAEFILNSTVNFQSNAMMPFVVSETVELFTQL